MSTKVSGVGQLFSAAKADAVNTDQKEGWKTSVKFSELLSQNASQSAQNYASQTSTASSNTSVNQEYSQYQYKDTAIQESKPVTTENNVSKIQEKVSDYAERVKDVLEEELGVTEEEIETAMETLGLSYTDLVSQTNLAQLVSELTGENVTDLLCDESFMNVMQSVQTISADLLQELGITMEEFTALCAELTSTNNQKPTDDNAMFTETQSGATEEVVQQNVQNNVTEDADVSASADKTVLTKVAQATENPVEEQAVAVSKADQSSVLQEETTTVETTEEDITEEVVTVKQSNETSMGNEASKNQTGNQDLTQQGANVVLQQNVNAEPVVVNQSEFTQTYSQLVDIQNVMEQIVESARVTISADTTTMEMQLNPQNLGKIFMEITSKDGIISARLVAQNEVVKEALESQMVELKQNLNQAGVKVEAVEVTVSSHEFEKNLDDNGRQQEQLAEQQEEKEQSGKHSRRNIKLNDLEELSGVMSEEENLVAQMMQDEGNSMDLQA